ncbi:hypothetical protein [Streptomyces sp. WZ-12]|uniref:hypothetical protein n=1 Tax=Streptomyces sp. WZ-12 TaxID=3030210 RepID=UPI002380F5DE|nr:hypothetical protein [Streptomyces sp. WZ-12]
MDPNEALKNIRKALQDYEADTDYDEDGRIEAVSRLQEAFECLDEWLKKGGFPPSDWQC